MEIVDDGWFNNINHQQRCQDYPILLMVCPHEND